MKQIFSLQEIHNLKLSLKKPMLVFIYGDLWAGKTTLSQSIIQKQLGNNIAVTSPTYVYYNTYEYMTHFDLYRLRDYDEFVSIGWEEILDNNEGIILVEWPELLEPYYIPDLKITLKKQEVENMREIETS